ncbi:DNA polymerase III subunit delta [Alicyclobacillus dauci]|uniref:DNA polymerase III subunit delta n=1 Tax=Alicyclobacillus dauci TaxID=1475485 RepID=A0ABY6Z8X3_9BACL|nr:DNA polymerase III subunit delta [Alicyclobacillus dauci]WAH38525.1 DNA polymerase III subunit delta [Alicyclobacillus dauci]
MDFQSAYDQLVQGQVGPVYLLYGQEHLFMDMFVDKLVASTEAESVVRFDFEEDGIDEAMLELQSVSLFLQQPIVVIRNCTPFLSQGKSGSSADVLEAYVQNPIRTRTLVMSVSADKLDERKKLTKAAKRHIVIDCKTPKEPVAIRFLETVVATEGMDTDRAVLTELWHRTGSVSQAVNELRKLTLYAVDRSITVQDVRDLVAQTVEDTVFDWVDDVIQGRIATAMTSLVDLSHQGYDPLGLLAMLARQLRMMWYAKVQGGRGIRIEDIAKEVKVHPFAMKVAERQARNVTSSALETLIRQAADYEYDVKRGRRDPGQAIELLMLSCARSMSTRPRAK